MSKRILMLPGLGDVHWCFLKLQAWIKKMGPEWEMPEIWIWDIDGRPRTLEYLDFVPWVTKGGYFNLPIDRAMREFRLLYMQEGSPDVLLNFKGFDAFIGMNGNMRNGVDFSSLLGGAPINYEYGPVGFENSFGLHKRAELGPYFVLCFSGFGMFEKAWCKSMTASKIQHDLVAKLRVHFPKHQFIFTGCSWDDAFAKMCMGPKDVHLVGKTNLKEFFSLLECSDGYIGWCGGNSIMAQHLGVPTVEWWSRSYFPKHDRRGWETPHFRKKHLVLEVEDFNVDTHAAIAIFLKGANHVI